MGKTNTTKTPLADFQITTPEIPLLLQQAVTSKGILVSYTNRSEERRVGKEC